MHILQDLLIKEYFKGNYSDSDLDKEILSEHTDKRLSNFRYCVIPWLNTLIKFPSIKILEIGCGTGSTTVALLEQGSKVL